MGAHPGAKLIFKLGVAANKEAKDENIREQMRLTEQAKEKIALERAASGIGSTVESIETHNALCYDAPVSRFAKTTIGKPAQWLIEAAATIGLDLSGLTHEVTNYFNNHVLKRHGKGALAITDKDFDRIPAIVESPDLAIIGLIRKGVLSNAYVKRFDGETYLYFDEVLNSTHNRALRSRTFYKIVKTLDMEGFMKIVTMNERSDISRAKKIIAAGGHPGGEA